MDRREPDPNKQSDHDLLITLHEQVRAIRDAIKEISDSTKVKVEDHEVRLRGLEKKQWIASGAAGIVGAAVSLLIKYYLH